MSASVPFLFSHLVTLEAAAPQALGAATPTATAELFDFVGVRQNAASWCWVACVVMMCRSLGVRDLPDGRILTQCRVFALAHRKKNGLAPTAQEICELDIESQRLTGECDTSEQDRFRCVKDAMADEEGVVSETLRGILPGDRYVVKRSELGRRKLEPYVVHHVGTLKRPVAVLIVPAGSKSDRRHYILITGYDMQTRKYKIWDPDESHPSIRTPRLEQWELAVGAWKGAVFVEDLVA